MRRLAIPFLLFACACPPRAPAAADASVVVGDAGEADGGWHLTAPALDAWLRYQAALAAQAPPERRDAGAGADAGRAAAEAVREDVRRRARLERDLRERSGLTQDELERIEELVGAVVAQRTLARISGVEAVRELQAAAAGLKDQPKAQAELALADLEARAKLAEQYGAERARFGDQNVDVLLGRLPEVEQAWDAMSK